MENVLISDYGSGSPFPRRLYMIPMRGQVVLPMTTVSFDVARDKSLRALERALEEGGNLFLTAQKRATVTNPAPKDLNSVGCVARVKQVIKLPNGVSRILVEGLSRSMIAAYVSINPCFEVEVLPLEDVPSEQIEIDALSTMLKDAYADFSKLESKVIDEQNRPDPDEPEAFCWRVAQFTMQDTEEKQDFLCCNKLSDRMEKTLVALNRALELLQVEKKIAGKVRKAMEQSQREYYLREQAKAIHEELGDGEEELDEFVKKAEKLKLPTEALEKVKKEVARMQRMSPTSPEAGVSRSYVEWLLDVPWHKATTDNRDLAQAARILDEDHYGLEKVKERILEYIAVMTLTKRIKGPILCFVGPPGVGKTSIVRSIARALDRKFVQMSLGGVRDEAEIRGHRRTYIGAIPGAILYHMKQAGTVNPVFLLDEIDKMSSDYRGDPASAMLEVLDPEQNNKYRDHYLEVAYDLSKVLFVTTANTLETVPAPLLDRMEVIELSGYTVEEKVRIGEKYLLPKQCAENGLADRKIEIPDEVLQYIVTAYTRESGVRNLERHIGTVCRKIACRIVGGEDNKEFSVTKEDIEAYLGVPRYLDDELNEADLIGEATGLAWTSVGGTTLPIEVALMPGKGEIILTGSLGDVMKESARTAISVVRSMAEEFGIRPERFAETDIHLHVPEGAIPKDGPSAGITIATAVMSAFSGVAVDRYVAMTGEITLRGKVLPIGGLKEKLLAARRYGVKTVVIPGRNKKDLSELPQAVLESLDVRFADTIEDVFAVALRRPQ